MTAGDEDSHDVGHLRIYDIKSGPVISMLGHPKLAPYIEGDLVSKSALELIPENPTALKFVPRNYNVNFVKENPPGTTQSAFESFAKKLR